MMPSLLSTSYRRRFGFPQACPAATRRAVLALFAAPAPALDRAGQLDRLADAELAAGRHVQAERLAHEAAELRERRA